MIDFSMISKELRRIINQSDKLQKGIHIPVSELQMTDMAVRDYMKSGAKYLAWAAILLPLLLIAGVIVTEYLGYTQYISFEPPFEVGVAGQVMAAIGSVSLSGALVALYWRQAKIQSIQKDLMQNEHKPRVEFVSARFPDEEERNWGWIVSLTNSGKGTAVNLRVETDVLVDTDAPVQMNLKEEDLSRNSSNSDVNKEPFHQGGNYLSPNEGEVEFHHGNKVGAEEIGGTKSVTGSNPFLIHYFFARVEDDELDLMQKWTTEERKKVYDAIDFDRVRAVYTLYYEDIDGNEYSRKLLDYIIPVVHGKGEEEVMKAAIRSEEYDRQKKMDAYKRSGRDPLHDRVEHVFNEESELLIPPYNTS